MREPTSTLPVQARARRYRELAAKMGELAAGCRMSEARASYLALSQRWNSLAEESERSETFKRAPPD